MQLTGMIIFYGALVALILWFIIIFNEIRNWLIHRAPFGEELVFQLMPGLVIFFILAISAGMAWG